MGYRLHPLLREKGFERIAASPEAEDAWTDHVNELAVGTLLSETASWFFGANIEGKKRTILTYLGGAKAYRIKCDEVAANGYEGFVFE
jgi:cyclohexanone monooxygenase